ncbi:MAG: translocation and assembly module subunit TamB [Sodalis sp. Psp]|nr:translocation and assembly module subunit TamB [Sodalis sp. Psp]MCR3756910.1 translocation and assembly module subunit TamB [Sodalis sp. Ppy]
MSLFKKICLGILILLGALAFLIGTSTGMRLVLSGVVSWVPGLEIASVSGDWRDLTIKQLRYQIPGITVVSGELHLVLDFSCLRHLRLCVHDLTLEDVNIRVQTAELKPLAPKVDEQDKDGSIISTPYPLIMRCLALNNVQVKVDDTAASLNKFNTNFTFQDNNLIVAQTRISGLLVALSKMTAAVAEQENSNEAIKLHTRLPKQKWTDVGVTWEAIRAYPSLVETLSKLLAQPLLPPLPSLTLPLNLALLELEGEDLCLSGDINLVITYLCMQVSIHNQHVETQLNINSPQGLFHAFGSAKLSGQRPVSMTVNTTLNIDPLKGEKIKFTIDGNLRDELHADLNLSGPLNAQLDMKIHVAQAGLLLSLALDSQVLQWPLTGAPQYQIKDVSLRLDGEARDYRLTLKAKLNGKNIPQTDIQLDAKGNTKGFTLSRLRLAALQGSTDLSAVVDWQSAINWRSQLSFSGINTAYQWPDWPARLDGKITVHGSLHDGNWQLRVPELNLKGNIQQNTLIARGSSISGDGNGQWQVPQLLLVLGRNQLTLKGEVKQQFVLDATLNAPALNGISPELSGQVQGDIKLRGDFHAPQLLVDFNAHGLRWGGLTIHRVELKGDIRSSDIIRGDVQLRLDKLHQGALSISQLTIATTGDEKQHQLKLAMRGDPVGGQLQINGRFDRQQQRWQGTLSRTSFDTPVGEWRLMPVMTLDYQAETQKFFIDPHCWQNPNAQICVPKNIEAGASGQASLRLNRFDIEMLKSLLPEDIQAVGIFTGRADIRWTAGSGLPQGKISLVGNKGVKVSQTVQSKTPPLFFETLTFNLVLNKGVVSFDWLIKIADNGRFNGQVQVVDLQNRRNLSGNVNINGLSLALLNPLMSRGKSVDGVVNAVLNLGGNVQQPQLHGQLKLEHLMIKGNFMPFVMTDSRLALSFSGTNSTLQGLISTPHGQVTLTGSADWSCMEAWRAHINAKGNQVRITVPPMVQLIISPDIVFKATPELFALNGKIDIPWASIEIKELPQSVVSVSSDEVLLDNNLQPMSDSTKGTEISINSDLLLHFGNDVHINAFGLKAKLKGDLKVEQDKQKLELNGQITIPSGHFYAYGQNLIINQGQMLFSGPIDQPYLNIEAIRNPDFTEDNVTAGIRLTGLADQPKIEVFSNPLKSQQEALSYLLRGQGLDASGPDNKMTSMLIGIGIAQSGQVVSKIGQAFGVSDLSLDTQGIGDNSQVVVSGYIAPDLQIKYGVGIFDSLATITLRYRLMSKFYLEAVSGLGQALDLLYRFEF